MAIRSRKSRLKRADIYVREGVKMIVDIFNTNKKYNIIYADPPWKFTSKQLQKENGKRFNSLDKVYLTEKTADMKLWKIKNICNNDAVGESDKERSDFEHDVLNEYKDLTAKQKREKLDELFVLLADRHNYKYEHRELEILKELYNTPRTREGI